MIALIKPYRLLKKKLIKCCKFFFLILNNCLKTNTFLKLSVSIFKKSFLKEKNNLTIMLK